MTAAGYEALHLDDIPTVAFSSPGLPNWKPLRRALGIGAFGVNAWIAGAPGEILVEDHDEATADASPGHEELYVVLTGLADFTAGDDTFEVRAGSIVYLRDPTLRRTAVAREAGTTVLSVGAPADSFSPSEWEERFLRNGSTDGAGI